MAVPPMFGVRILRAVEGSERPRRTYRLGYLRLAAVMAGVLVLAAGIGVIRAAPSPAGVTEGTWSATGSMVVARAYQTATLLPNGKVLVAGGRGVVSFSAPWQSAASGVALGSAELFDPETGAWSSAGTLHTPRFGQTATLLKNGDVLIAGGKSAIGPVDSPVPASIASAELYNPRTNAWSLTTSMLSQRSDDSATLLPDGRVLVAGGIDTSSNSYGTVLTSAELFDPTSDTWRPAAPMPSPRAEHTAILLTDGRVLVIGGIDHIYDAQSGFNSTGLSTTSLYDPARDSWEPGPNMLLPRILPSGTRLPDGRVLVVGDGGVNEQTAEIYDPSNEVWVNASAPAVPRADSPMVLLRSGAVLVAGGVGETSAQQYDARHNTWSSAGALTAIRSGATATLLSSGQVLVAGGFGGGAKPLTTAEIYDPAGRYPSAIRVRTSFPLAWTELAVAIAALAVLVVSLWVARRRQARSLRSDDVWIDA